MTVGELIAELQKYPLDLPVTAEGADCGGYDVISGLNVYVERRKWAEGQDLPAESIHIAHNEQ